MDAIERESGREPVRILLIAPASGKWRLVGRKGLFRGKVFRFSLLSLLTVAAETPEGCVVRVVDEQVEAIPWDAGWDLVGVTAMTAAAPRAYEIADAFRARGVSVILGGMHPTFLPDEALLHADAVLVGDAEGVWPEVVRDAAAGRLAGIYQAGTTHTLEGLRMPPRGLITGRHYATVQAVQATRGCPHRCAFCSVSAFHNGLQRRRPVGEVAAEVAAMPGKFVLFVDDSLAADAEYAEDLFSALAPLKKRWMSQMTLGVSEDEALLRLMSRSGCVGVFVGLETFSEENLTGVEKGFNRVEEYRKRIAAFHRHGIGVEAGIVLGFDGDGPDVFSKTLHKLEEIGVDMIQVSVLTPLPGTPFFKAMDSRIVERDWSRYDYHHVVFRPQRLSVEDLQAGHDWLTRQFYRPGRIAARLLRLLARPRGLAAFPYAAAINLAYLGRVLRWKIKGYDPLVKQTAPAIPSTSWEAGHV